MSEDIREFYQALAEYYDLIFEDWNRSIERWGSVLGALLAAHLSAGPLRILDCACGIGTQTLGLAALGHHMVASDLSPAAVARAAREAGMRSLEVSFHVSDMTSLQEIAERGFDAVIAMDNALPHLTPAQLTQAAHAIGSRIRKNGLFVAGIRDYDRLIVEKPTVQQPVFCGTEGNRRIVHQVWDWVENDRYILHVYITTQSDSGWDARHFVGEYRCMLRAELSSALNAAGFTDIRWLMPAESGLYTPMVMARMADPDAAAGHVVD
jgi:SAM-dependent methyltransferase